MIDAPIFSRVSHVSRVSPSFLPFTWLIKAHFPYTEFGVFILQATQNYTHIYCPPSLARTWRGRGSGGERRGGEEQETKKGGEGEHGKDEQG